MVRRVTEMLAALRARAWRKRLPRCAWLSVGLALLFCGALCWARGRDPFQRVWFTVKPEGQAKARCVAVLPKNAARPYPLVVYLHEAGGSVLRAGKELRQMAELGLAAVAMDYCQTNDAMFERQFEALLRLLRRQKWADTNAVAWVGFSLGAELLTRFALQHPEAQPQLLVGLAGGWRPELATNALASTVWFLLPEPDATALAADARGAVSGIQTNGARVIRALLPGVPLHFGAERAGVFRALGELMLVQLREANALGRYRSIAAGQSEAWPLWVWWLPAFLWFGSRYGRERRRSGALHSAGGQPHLRTERWLRRGGILSAMLAAGVTTLHLGVPRLPVSKPTSALARHLLVPPPEREDFEYLAAQSGWQGQRLETLLEHLRLARYNRNLVSWKHDDVMFREFVLSPVIGPAPEAGLHWRRALWESCYPRVRREPNVEAAAQRVVRHLRERVTITVGASLPRDVADIWQRQITDGRGFERLTVAALRAVGIAARLDGNGRAELFSDGQWVLAPKPVIGAPLLAAGVEEKD